MAHRPPGWISPCSRTTSWRGTCAWSLPTDLATASPHPARTLPRGLAVGRRGPCRPSRRRTFCGSGVSSGAPYAAVCAAPVSDRVAGAGLVSGVTDFGWRGAWDGYLEAEATLMRIGDEAKGTEWCEARYGADGSRFEEAGVGDLSPADTRTRRRAFATGLMMTSVREAFRQGVSGYAQDIVLQGRPWSFDATAIVAPVQILHGEADTLAPISHGHHTG